MRIYLAVKWRDDEDRLLFRKRRCSSALARRDVDMKFITGKDVNDQCGVINVEAITHIVCIEQKKTRIFVGEKCVDVNISVSEVLNSIKEVCSA